MWICNRLVTRQVHTARSC